MSKTAATFRQQLKSLAQATADLTSELSIDAVLQRVVDLSRELVDARYGALGVLDEKGNIVDFIVSGLTPEEKEGIGDPPKGLGILGIVRRENKPVRISDMARHPKSVGFPTGHPAMKNFLGVPIVSKDKIVGSLYVTEKHGAPRFSKRDAETLELFAAQAAVAIQNAQLYASAAKLAAMEERERIGMDLHDGVIQSIYSIGLGMEDVIEHLKSDPTEAEAKLGKAIDGLNEVIRDIRLYISDLRMGVIAQMSIQKGLEQLVAEVQEVSGLEINLVVSREIDPKLSMRQRMQLVQIAKESLSNIVKHAFASAAAVSLLEDKRELVLSVRDDGVGISPAENGDSPGHGLKNMEKRARSMGGTLTVNSGPDEGTEITIRVPMDGKGR